MPWVTGHLHPTQPPVELFRRHGAVDSPIGRMLTPELAAQVVAEHRHAVEFRALMRGAEQRRSEQSTQGPDSPAAIAAWAGYVPLADVLAALRDWKTYGGWVETALADGQIAVGDIGSRESYARYLADRFAAAARTEKS
jgi:hypothetical protein